MEAFELAISFMPKKRRNGCQQQEGGPDPGRVCQPHRRAILLWHAVHPEEGEHREENDQRRNQLHHADAQVAQPAVDAQRAALSGFREEKADVAHARCEVSASKTAEQGDDDKDPVRRRGVLNGNSQPHAGIIRMTVLNTVQ